MSRTERAILITALVYMIIYFAYFLMQMYLAAHGRQVSPWAILPYHFLCMGLNIAAFIVTIRDLYLRPFANPNSKLTWLLLILLTGGIGWLVYIFRHALHPRSTRPVT